MTRRFVSALLFVLLATPAAAQTTSGARVGVSLDPDQFYFGGHVETRPLVERLHFRPNAEIGIGDDVTIVGLNFELAYKFPTQRPWTVYAAGGPALNIIHSDVDTESQPGFNIAIGVEHRDGLFFEVKAGGLDSPDFKIGIGYIFRK